MRFLKWLISRIRRRKAIIKKVVKNFVFLRKNISSLKLKTTFAKGLDYKKYSISFIQNLDYILCQISSNYIDFSTNRLDLTILKNCGIDINNPIYIYDFKYKINQFINIIEILYKYKKFTTIFFVLNANDEKNMLKKIKDLKAKYLVLNKENVNLEIVSQLEKLNTNKRPVGEFLEDKNYENGLSVNGILYWKEKLNYGYLLRSYKDKFKEILIKESINKRKINYDIVASNNSKITNKIEFVLKVDYLSNIYQINKSQYNIKVFTVEKDECLCFNFRKVKICKFFDCLYLSFIASIKPGFSKSFRIFFSDKKVKNSSEFILQKNDKNGEDFKLKIRCCDKEFENLYNDILPKKILMNRLNFNKSNTSEYEINSIKDIINLSKEKVDYSSLYNYITNKVLGVEIKGNYLYYKPTNFSFFDEYFIKVDQNDNIFYFKKEPSTSQYKIYYKEIEYWNCRAFELDSKI